jgi:hypothetical protein
MTNRFYGIKFGQTKADVVEAAVTDATKDVEIRVTYDAANNGKQAMLNALEYLEQRIIEDTWPPA